MKDQHLRVIFLMITFWTDLVLQNLHKHNFGYLLVATGLVDDRLVRHPELSFVQIVYTFAESTRDQALQSQAAVG